MHRISTAMILLVSAVAWAEAPHRDDFPPVETTASIDVAAFNAALAADPERPSDPMAIAERFLGGLRGGNRLRMEAEFNAPEGPSRLRVVLMRDGLLDDSVRGDWREVELGRDADGRWRAIAAKHASWCLRGALTDRFTARGCP